MSRRAPLALGAAVSGVALVVLVWLTSVVRWRGWRWDIWDPLVAIGTLALAGATIALALSTRELSARTSEEIKASHEARRHDAQRSQIERVYRELLDMIELLYDDSVYGGDYAVRMPVARARLRAAIVVAGGAGRWPQTDLLVRDGSEVDRNALIRQSDGAVRELNGALSRLDAAE